MPSLPLPKCETIKFERNGLYHVLKNAYIPTQDGSELCANIYLPLSCESGKTVPTLLSMCPYGKDIHALEWGLPQTDLYAKMNSKIEPIGPDAALEALDPLFWSAEHGYAIVRIDCRGIGGTPGVLDPWSLHRSLKIGQDAEGNGWAASQSWSNGKVGMSGISYLGMGYWFIAQQNPPALKAIIPWEAGNDLYLSTFRPGGIFNTNFLRHWRKNCVLPYQHGRLEGVPDAELETQRVDFLDSSAWEFRSDGIFPLLGSLRSLNRITVPIYSTGNWSDTEVHSPGNIFGYMWSKSKTKYPEMHSGDHINGCYGTESLDKQRHFLDRFLKDHADSLDGIPKVDLIIREGSKMYRRTEENFSLLDTEYREYFLTPTGMLQSHRIEHENRSVIAEYEALKDSCLFTTAPLEEDFELLGFPYMVLGAATTAKDMDILVSITNIAPDGTLVLLEGNHGEPSVAVTRGYMRLSHRELDPHKSTDHLVVLAQQHAATVEPNRPYVIKMPIQYGIQQGTPYSDRAWRSRQ